MHGPYPGELRMRVIDFVERGLPTWSGRTVRGQRQFCDSLAATLSRERDLRTHAPRRKHFSIGEIFATDPRTHQRATGPHAG